jgi:hypothetical protein
MNSSNRATQNEASQRDSPTLSERLELVRAYQRQAMLADPVHRTRGELKEEKVSKGKSLICFC